LIKKIEIKGFRIFRDFTWEPKAGVNIVVGANSVGKSTVLDAIELVTKCTLHGLRAKGNVAPDWFNAGFVSEYFDAVRKGQSPEPPAISIAVTLGGDPSLSNLQGCQGPHKEKEDEPGLWFQVKVPETLIGQFSAEVRAIVDSGQDMLPTEFYECVWTTYKGDALVRRPKYVSCSRIDTSPEPFSRAVDSLARSLIDSQLDDDQMRKVSGQIRDAKARIDTEVLSSITLSENEMLKAFGLETDKSSRSDWKNSVVLARKGLPLAVLGSADQVIAKAAASMAGSGESQLLLLEEPECHLSHTTLNKLLAIVEAAMDEGQQAFVTTHSPFVLNRLGLDRMFVLANGGTLKRINDLSPETVRYFKRLSGYDTLRIILAEKTVLVEGPTDEMVFDWAFHKLRGVYPEEKGIDVIEYGTRYKRAFELAAAVGKLSVAALRDNDDEGEEHWKEARDLLEKTGERQLFVGHDGEGHTIEPQMVHANQDRLGTLKKVTNAPSADRETLEKYLLKHKTLWSLYLVEYDTAESEKLEVPAYIKEAIDFVDPEQEALE
jgi:putative ATP-dependent endonuclease of OLD family